MHVRAISLIGCGLLALGSLGFVGCSDDGPACAVDGDCTSEGQVCGGDDTCVAAPPGFEIGHGDGSASSVTFNVMHLTALDTKPVDIAFHPTRKGEAWVVGYGDHSIWLGTGLDGDAPKWEYFTDPAARHFMYQPPAIAMGAADTWGTCGDNDNAQNNRVPNWFMGPALFSASLDIFPKVTPLGLGSHLDMLHSTPFCRGIAHVDANWYWAFNAYDKALDLVNFAQDHGPGMDDHSDGEIYRYAAGQVLGAEDGTPSHLIYDPSDKFLYVADTGNGRIVKLDTTAGTKGKSLPRRNEPLADQGYMDGTQVEEVVPPGVLVKPSGIELHGGLLYVTDAETSTFHVFEKSGKEVRRLETGLPKNSLAGFNFGPEGRIWFTDKVEGRIVRIDPKR